MNPMRTAIFASATLLLASLSAFAADPRNTPDYRVLFDLDARGKSDLVNGYGGYVQVFSRGAKHLIRYCENFEGKGTNGRPNPNRSRMKLVPIGKTDDSAFRCRDFTPDELAIGQPLIKMGDRSLFAMKSARWSEPDGGEILFQFAKKLPVIGSPTYRTLRIRATRSSTALDYVVETVIPKTGVFPSHFYRFDVSGSALGFPNGISAITIDPAERTQRAIDLDVLEGPVDIKGDGKEAPRAGNWPRGSRRN